MSFLLDTNVLSQMRRPALAGQSFRAWMDEAVAGEFFISAITLLEIEFGAYRAKTQRMPHAALLREWIDDHILPLFESRILPVDAAVAVRCAPFHVPGNRRYPDTLIAATALVHDLVVVTRNTRDFEPMGVRLLNPWNA